jgi:hypothetical protein
MVFFSKGNHVKRGSHHRLDIARFWIVDAVCHLYSECVICLNNRDGEKGGRQEARGTNVQWHDLTVLTLLEIAGMYIARAKV